LPEPPLQEIDWPVEQEVSPLLVVSYLHEGEMLVSLMYLAQADEPPVPSTEVKGLLLLERQELHRLCQVPQTLAQFLTEGGRAILTADFDHSLLLEPFIQLRLFSQILTLQPGL
jgi:hypothetical protein